MFEVQTADAAGETLTFSEDINSGGFLGLSLKNGLLNLITLTLYRFWGRTEVRRRVWARVSLNDEPFEYTGRGSELFIGFLIALVTVGLPFLLVVFGAQFLGPIFAVLIIIPLYLVMFALFGAAIFLAFRYLASRSAWRGVRFQLKGSPVEFGMAYLGYALLSGITLGWFQPAMTMRLAEKLWGGIRFGDLRLRWRPQSDNGLYGPFAIGWVGAVASYFVLVGVLVGGAMGMTGVMEGRAPSEPPVTFLIFIYVVFFAWALVLMVIFAPYQAAVLRAVARSLSLGDARFRIDVKALEMAGLMITNILMLIFSLGLLSPLVQARTARFIVRRLKSEGTAPISEAQQAPRGPKQGEGLADAFGFSPI